MSQKRGILARLGLVLLNIPAPGVSLIRLGHWRLAAALFGLLLVILLFMRFGPPAPFAAWAFAMILAIAVLLGSMLLSWLLSRNKEEDDLPQWRRWYAVAVAAILTNTFAIALLDRDKLAYRNFYLPAEAMSPTLFKGDRFVAYMRRPNKLTRGDIVLVRTRRGDIYIKRLAGLPGDVIGVSNGLVVLNGKVVRQQLVKVEKVKEIFATVPARRMKEQFPGERRQHHIYDVGVSLGDYFGPVRVPSGHYFVLGDHRDRSADSRFRPEEQGLALVSASDIVGRPLFHSWGSSRTIGTPILDRS